MKEAVKKIADDPKSTKDEVYLRSLRERSEAWNRIVARAPPADYGLLSHELRERSEAWHRIVGRDPSAEEEVKEDEEAFFLPDLEFTRVLVNHLVQS